MNNQYSRNGSDPFQFKGEVTEYRFFFFYPESFVNISLPVKNIFDNCSNICHMVVSIYSAGNSKSYKFIQGISVFMCPVPTYHRLS
ncbi:MAG: hypothetical protein H6Q23_1985 [Bacteroidetes bacterium]|nr:hypothetical protein [Bacteroidota bacterium]